jgi:ERCC4-type nuclease
MVLLEDSRQQAGKHKNIHAYCEQQGIEIIRQALNVGDYMLSGPEFGGIKGDICVDTKTGVPELASNCFQEHERFRDELERAQRCGIQLVVLIEETLPYGRLDYWRSPMGRDGLPKYKFSPVTLRKALITMQDKYGVKFRFCDGRSTGKRLIEYLKGERT